MDWIPILVPWPFGPVGPFGPFSPEPVFEVILDLEAIRQDFYLYFQGLVWDVFRF